MKDLELLFELERSTARAASVEELCAAARKLLTVIYVILTKPLDYWFLEERLYQKKLKQLAAA